MDKPNYPLKGLGLFVAAPQLFACMSATTMYLATRYNVPSVITVNIRQKNDCVINYINYNVDIYLLISGEKLLGR